MSNRSMVYQTPQQETYRYNESNPVKAIAEREKVIFNLREAIKMFEGMLTDDSKQNSKAKNAFSI